MTDAPAPAHEFDWPDRVVIGTLGRPGARTFYLQVRTGPRLVSLALEKQQSALMAEMLDEILDDLMALEGNPHSVPASTPVELVDNDPLDPVQEWFRVGAIGLGWRSRRARAVCAHRSRGLATTAATGTAATRSPVRAACSRPWSSRLTPGVRPASSPVALAVVRPCRTRSTVAMASA